MDDLDYLKVLETKPCLKDNRVYRATLSMPDAMLELIKSRLRGKLYIGYLRCSVYPVKPHMRCFQCQRHGHMQGRCKNPPRCAKCGEGHETSTCTSQTIRCINCADHEDHKANCSSHRADASSCPIFIKYRNDQEKK